MNILEKIRHGLIVSCQALEDEPLHSPFIMSRMALAAKMGGAVGIRANSPEDIKAIKEIVDLPIIGIYKINVPGYDVYITPTMEAVKLVSDAGADIIALDATDRAHPAGYSSYDFIREVKGKFPNNLIMADISTYEEGLMAEKAGADIVSTTLSGYTDYSKATDCPDWDLIEKLSHDLNIPLIAEGHIWTPEEAVKTLKLGAFAVVVGSAITRPHIITQRYVKKIKEAGF